MTETDADSRKRRRREAAARRKAERARVLDLQARVREPAPNEIVRLAQTRAQQQRDAAARERQKAAIAVDRRKRREFQHNARRHEDQARSFDRDATKARETQLSAHWAGQAITETVELAQSRGEAYHEEPTEVLEWIRDKHGAIARDEDGMPLLRGEKAKARRTNRNGLELLRDKGAIMGHAYEVGIWYAQVCADAQVARLSGREETGLKAPTITRAPSLADWKIAAIEEKAKADAALRRVFVQTEGDEMVALLEKVCFAGASTDALAQGNVQRRSRLEGKVATGLAILRHHRLARATESRQRADRAAAIAKASA